MTKVMHLEVLRIHLPSFSTPEREVDCTFCLIRFTRGRVDITSMLVSIRRRKLRRPSSEEAREYFRLRPEFTQTHFVVALMEKVEVVDDEGEFFVVRTCFRTEDGELSEAEKMLYVSWDPFPVYVLAVVPSAR